MSDPTQAVPSPAAIAQFDPSILMDIHLPENISLWPPAYGWWILSAVILLLILLSYFISYLKRRHCAKKTISAKQLKMLAMKELALIEKDYEAGASAHATIKQLSVFLRRFSLSQCDRESVASLTDQQWLVFLDNMLSTARDKQDKPFSKQFAELLSHAPYQSADSPIFNKERTAEQIPALFNIIKTLITSYKKPAKETHHV